MTDLELDAWLYGTLVAQIRRVGRGRAALAFTADALDRWGIASPVVSGLLPLSLHEPSTARVRAWLDGLLPEGRARTELALRAGVDPDDPVGFLAHYGKDTAGALVLVPAGADPDPPGTLTPVDEHQIAALLVQAEQYGAADQVTSITGLETKIALTATAEGWASPVGRPPSTHIVKLGRPSDSLAPDLIDTEAAALNLARTCGLTTVNASITSFAGMRTIVVERYDRFVDAAGRLTRIHQEDAAQVLGLDTRDPDRKFGWNREMPSLRAIARGLVAMGVMRPTRLLALTTFNVAIGNADAHAKNISVLHLPDGATQLAPAYDVAMHQHLRHAERRFAMSVDGALDIAKITAMDLVAEGRSWGLSVRDADRTVRTTLETLEDALQTIDRDAHPGVTARAWDTVETRTRTLLAGAAGLRAAPR